MKPRNDHVYSRVQTLLLSFADLLEMLRYTTQLCVLCLVGVYNVKHSKQGCFDIHCVIFFKDGI